MRGRAPTLCQEGVSEEGQMHTLFTKDLTLPAPIDSQTLRGMGTGLPPPKSGAFWAGV